MAAGADAWLDSLGRLARDGTRARVPIGEILAAAGDGGIAAAILLFALPNALPTLPGMSTVLGAPLLLFTAELFLGRAAWVPGWLARMSISRDHLGAAVELVQSVFGWSRGATHPRLHAFAGPVAMRLAGGMGCLLAILLVLPLPLVNIPIGVALSLLSFGGLRGDGLAVLLGFVAGTASLALAAGVVWGASAVL